MTDCYMYTTKGYKPVEPDWEEPTGGGSELCPHLECQKEIVVDGDGWRQCGACGRIFYSRQPAYSRAGEIDETVYFLYTREAVLAIFGRRIPPVPDELSVCPLVPK